MILFFAFIVVLVLLFDIVMVASMIAGAPFVPSRQRTVAQIIDLLPKKSDITAVDLGAGDGRIVIALAQAGVPTHGYEINPFLVAWAKYKIQRAGLSGKAFMHWQNLWRVPLANYNVVVVYGIFYMLPRLVKKFDGELQPGTVVISEAFQLPHTTFIRHVPGLYVYEFPFTKTS